MEDNSRYLFRGKSVDTGTWIHGTYLEQYHSAKYGRRIDAIFYSDDIKTYRIPVWPETLGQCTGLRDTNGTLIFESDVVKVLGTRRVKYAEPRSYHDGHVECYGIVEFKRGQWIISYETELNKEIVKLHRPETVEREVEGWRELYYYQPNNGGWSKWNNIEVIGSIHDTPSLLQSEQEGVE